jgi:hypothetical protein
MSLTGTTTVNTTAAPGTGSRWDLIYVKQNDPDKGDTDNLPVVGVVNGTSSTGTPTVPLGSVPAGGYVLAQARIFSGTTSTNGGANTIAQSWQHTAMRGAPIPFLSQGDRNGVTAFKGLTGIRLDYGGLLETYNGTIWTSEALGLVGFTDTPATSTGFAQGLGETLADEIASVPFIGGRRYRVEYDVKHSAPSGSNLPVTVSLRTTAVGGTGVGSSALLRAATIWTAPSTNSGKDDVTCFFYTPVSDGALRVIATITVILGTSTINIANRQLTVTDLGAQI